jgi:hypothetical protein
MMGRSGLDDRVILMAAVPARILGLRATSELLCGSAASIPTNNLDRVAARGSMPSRHCSIMRWAEVNSGLMRWAEVNSGLILLFLADV